MSSCYTVIMDGQVRRIPDNQAFELANITTAARRLIRPSVLFGRGDAFVIPIARMLRRLPVFPLFGRGQTQLQPAYVEDVADAIARMMQNTQSPMCYELGGPRVYKRSWTGSKSTSIRSASPKARAFN
jgi:hypothetical protein